MKGRDVRALIQMLEARTLFSLPFGTAITSDITLNPSHSVAQVNNVSGPLLSADFNNDGKADLIFGGRNGGDSANPHYVGVMLGSANGTFTDAGTLVAPITAGQLTQFAVPAAQGINGDPSLSAYAAGDFNGDGNQDLAIVYPTLSNGDYTYDLLVGYGDGRGNFSPQPVLAFDATPFIPAGDTIAPASIAVAKFNQGNDDQLAVAIPYGTTNEGIDTLGLDDTGHFARLNTFQLGIAPGNDQLVTGHFDSGTLPDVAVYDPNASEVEIVSNAGDDFFGGGLFPVAPPPADASQSVIAAGDFNADGMTDLVVQQTAPGVNATNLDVLLNNGSGGTTALAPVSDINPGVDTNTLDWLKVGDFDGNGSDEIATRYGVFRADAAGTLLYSGFSTFSDTLSNNAVVGDFNGDGAADLVSLTTTDIDAESLELIPGATTPLSNAVVNLSDQSIRNEFGAILAAKFTASVSGTNGSPTGSVDFFARQKSSGTVVDLQTVALTAGTASITPTNVPAGTDSIFAAYGGNTTFQNGSSSGITVSYAGGGAAVVLPSLESAVIKSNLPVSAIAGRALGRSVTVGVKNTGASLFNQKTTLDVFASLDSAIDPSDTLVGTVTRSLRIPAGRTAFVGVPIKSLPTGLAGTYHFLEETVNGGFQTSTAPTAPSMVIAAPLVSLVPVINSVTFLHNGSSTTTITITNEGNIMSPGISQIYLFGSNTITVTNATQLVTRPMGIHLRPNMKTVIRLTANPLETQLGLLDANFVVEVIDANGKTETASFALPKND
jgi:Bacterial Ig-like domain (group 3)/FG-GAP-like repeat